MDQVVFMNIRATQQDGIGLVTMREGSDMALKPTTIKEK
jgi:hypothetical protein